MLIIQSIGNLGRDAEVKTINDRQYLSFSVASTEKRNNEEQTTWLSILYPYQESLLPFLKKGQQVYVSGRLKAGIYQNQQSFGIDLSVFATTLQLCGSKREESTPTVPAASPAGPVSVPTGAAPSTLAPSSVQSVEMPSQPPVEEELPF